MELYDVYARELEAMSEDPDMEAITMRLLKDASNPEYVVTAGIPDEMCQGVKWLVFYRLVGLLQYHYRRVHGDGTTFLEGDKESEPVTETICELWLKHFTPVEIMTCIMLISRTLQIPFRFFQNKDVPPRYAEVKDRYLLAMRHWA